jgi:hypothetical protein
MMQQEIMHEEEQGTEKVITRKRLELRYATSFFWFTRFLLLVSLGVFIWFMKKNPNPYQNPLSFVYIYFIIQGNIIWHHLSAWHLERSKEHWMREHRRDVYIVNEEGIEWQHQDKAIYLVWDDIDYAYEKNGVHFAGKTGEPEKKIRFGDDFYIPLASINNKRVFRLCAIRDTMLTNIIKDRAPKLKPPYWEEIKEEVLEKKYPRSTSQIGDQTASFQIFSYHTQTNKTNFQGIAALWGVGILLLLAGIAKITNTPPQTTQILVITLLIVFTLFPLLRWQWYVRSQIETDDLGIALVESKGVTWRVLWFTIAKYATNQKYGIITTKDGKTYKFPLNTARTDELHKEIMRRIGVGGTE